MFVSSSIETISATVAEQVAAQLRQQLQQQLEQQLQQQLLQAQNTIEQLQAELAAERQARQAAEQQLRIAEASSAAANDELSRIHQAIAEQLQFAEAEELVRQQAEAAREQQLREQLQRVESSLEQERFWRELLQARVETLRSAAADLFTIDATMPALPITGSGKANGSAVETSRQELQLSHAAN